MSDIPYFEDMLGFVADLRIRSMFGGHGVYCGSLMFGLIDEGVLYLKVDESTRPEYQLAGSAPFAPIMKDKAGQPRPMVMNGYWQVPDTVLEDPETLQNRVTQAIGVSRKAPDKKKKPNTAVDDEFKGLGKVSQGWLSGMGVHSLADLRHEGAIHCYKTLKALYPKRVSLNLLWGLYALANGMDIKAIDEDTKSHLKSLL